MSDFFTDNEVKVFLEILQHVLITKEGFLYSEEGRFARATLNLIKSNKIANEDLITFIEKQNEYIDELNVFKVNWKNYLTSLYFTLANENLLNDQLKIRLSKH